MTEFKFGENNKTFSQIFLIESTIIGISLVLIFSLVLLSITSIKLFNDSHNIQMVLSVLLSGIIFHILCEYTGINAWYSKDYCKQLVL